MNKPKTIEKIDATKMKGRYIYSVGRRKSATATVRMYKKGDGEIIVNNKKLDEYLDTINAAVVRQPLKLTGELKDLNFVVNVSGGGKTGQAEAIRHGICNGLLELDENLRPSLRSKGWLTRDARKKERKKPGLRKARRAPQWAKR